MPVIKKNDFVLTEGEQFLSEFLSEYLGGECDIYLQPSIEGNRPDMLLFYPQKGIFIIEIKDWKLERYCKRDGKFFKIYGKEEVEVADPISQVKRYKLLFEEALGFRVHCLLYFHNDLSNNIKGFVGDSVILFGRDDYKNILSFIKNSIIEHRLPDSKIIRDFLKPPFHTKDKGSNFKLTQQQKSLISHTPKSWRRVRGVAGSGKTLVIAQKAANLSSVGKRVLVICFNHTLKTYLKEAIGKVQCDFDWNLIEIFNFHNFMKIYLEENDIKVRGEKDFEQYERNLLDLVHTLIASQINIKSRQYDAILLDEAQESKRNGLISCFIF